MEATASAGLRPPLAKKQRRSAPTTVEALGNDVLCMIFSFLDLVHLIRCSAVCKSWSIVINKLKLLQIQYHKQHQTDSTSSLDPSASTERLINVQMEQLAMDQQRFSLQEGPVDIFQWKAHSVGFNKCRMKMGLILTGVGDKVMRLWSAESCKGLDEYRLPDKAPLIDFDFDEGKVVGLVGTRMCIWKRVGTRDLFSSREGLFTRGLCMRERVLPRVLTYVDHTLQQDSYVDPQAVVGCEDGRVRVFDMYSRKISQIIKMHPGAVSCLSFTDEQLIVSGSSYGGISISDLSSDQRVATLDTTSSTVGKRELGLRNKPQMLTKGIMSNCDNRGGIKTLCFNPSSYLLFAGSSTGYASCWDLRTSRSMWETRISPNVLYSMHHLQNDISTLAVGGIDGVLRIIDQDSGEVLSRCIVDENSNRSNRTTNKNGVEKKKAIRLSEDDRIDLMPNRPPITSLAVGMQKIVTTHSDKYIRVWKFRSK